ncbi:MAG: hypothetical protein ABI912_03930 [Actinomycetota bacterium]
MIEILFDLVLEFLVELLSAKVTGESAFSDVSVDLSDRGTRLVIKWLICAAAGLAGGAWWGARLSSVRSAPPKLFFVSIALAAAFTAASVFQIRRRIASGHPKPEPAHSPTRRWVLDYVAPARLASFALLNAAVAFGIALTFTPLHLG